MREVIDQEVLSQPIGASVKGAALIDPGEVVDEAAQHGAIIQHEGIDGDAFASDALGLFQSFFRGALTDAAETQWPFAIKPALTAISGRLSVGNNDHLLIDAGLSFQKLRCQMQTI